LQTQGAVLSISDQARYGGRDEVLEKRLLGIRDGFASKVVVASRIGFLPQKSLIAAPSCELDILVLQGRHRVDSGPVLNSTCNYQLAVLVNAESQRAKSRAPVTADNQPTASCVQ
jgi:hypothetical protein